MQKELSKQFSEQMTSKLWGLLENPEDEKALFAFGEEEILKRFNTLKMSLDNHEATVKQNRDLQTELNNLKNKPFFPFGLNSGGLTDYGEFLLVSHAWFGFLDETRQIGIVEVEWKKSGKRCLYMGIGSGKATLENFNADVRKIALYGQKIKG